MMGKWRVLVAATAAVVLSSCATPGETSASYILQGDIQAIINANELVHGKLFGARVADTTLVSTDGEAVTEDWMVTRGPLLGFDLFGLLPAKIVVYEVVITPDSQGGTNFIVKFPVEDRR